MSFFGSLGGVRRLTPEKIGLNPAAAIPMPHNTLPSVRAKGAVANAVMTMAAR